MPRNNNKKRCKAKNRNGEQCKRWAKAGWDVCHSHGAKGGAPERNSNAQTHGLFSKYLPKETMDIVSQINDVSPVDMLWMNIKMQFAQIMRSQQIMHVENKDDLTKEIKKTESVVNDKFETDKREWEIQFAWDKQANFLNAQSRAMGELRSMLKQFVELTNYDDERKLEAERMQAAINKTKAETDKLKAETKNEEDGTSRVVIVNDKEAMKKEMMQRAGDSDEDR
ncbi:phage terminase small subunit [Alteribacillus sp. JSM 102045]|uniref:phage terminase small subunit n=1 Tax=Alteribacillus sp. JSM 102045 TaxID=1562101 RepID=UPI0035BF2957